MTAHVLASAELEFGAVQTSEKLGYEVHVVWNATDLFLVTDEASTHASVREIILREYDMRLAK